MFFPSIDNESKNTTLPLFAVITGTRELLYVWIYILYVYNLESFSNIKHDLLCLFYL